MVERLRNASANNTNTNINVLPNVIYKYNHTYHRSIKCTLVAARKSSNHQCVYKALFGDNFKFYKSLLKQRVKFKIGDGVCVVRKNEIFEKGFTPNWTEEIFIVDAVKSTQPITYKLIDLKGKSIQRSFYAEEFTKIKAGYISN